MFCCYLLLLLFYNIFFCWFDYIKYEKNVYNSKKNLYCIDLLNRCYRDMLFINIIIE